MDGTRRTAVRAAGDDGQSRDDPERIGRDARGPGVVPRVVSRRVVRRRGAAGAGPVVGGQHRYHYRRAQPQIQSSGRWPFSRSLPDCCVLFTALGIGLSFASYTQFPIIAVATMLCLLQYVLTVLWIALARIWPFPTFGPAESSLTLIVLALVMPFIPRQLVTIDGVPLSLIDIAFAITVPNSLITLFISSRRLFRHLQAEAAAEGASVLAAPARLDASTVKADDRSSARCSTVPAPRSSARRTTA